MFDLIRAKYEPLHNVEMQGQLVESDVVIQQIAPLNNAQENTPNYALLALNLVMIMSAISLMVYGAIHMDDCPAQKMITISYIVMGGIFFLSRLLNCRHDILEALGRPNVPTKPKSLICVTFILQLLMLGWFAATCYWVYQIQPYIDKKDPTSPNYCSEEFYKNVFWGSTIALAGVGLVFLLTCCGLFYYHNRPADDD